VRDITSRRHDMTEATQQQIDRAVLAQQDISQVCGRLAREGFKSTEILAGLAATINDLVAGAANQATASAYFLGLAKQAALLAGEELGFKPGED
jgi:hypothetical protein